MLTTNSSGALGILGVSSVGTKGLNDTVDKRNTEEA